MEEATTRFSTWIFCSSLAKARQNSCLELLMPSLVLLTMYRENALEVGGWLWFWQQTSIASEAIHRPRSLGHEVVAFKYISQINLSGQGKRHASCPSRRIVQLQQGCIIKCHVPLYLERTWTSALVCISAGSLQILVPHYEVHQNLEKLAKDSRYEHLWRS